MRFSLQLPAARIDGSTGIYRGADEAVRHVREPRNAAFPRPRESARYSSQSAEPWVGAVHAHAIGRLQQLDAKQATRTDP